MAGPADATLARLTARVAKKLCREGQLMVTAESCTGGFLAKTLTDRPGSSECYDRGWITYSNNAKHAQLGVRLSDIERHGAVSRTIALAMVRGALQAFEGRGRGRRDRSRGADGRFAAETRRHGLDRLGISPPRAHPAGRAPVPVPGRP